MDRHTILKAALYCKAIKEGATPEEAEDRIYYHGLKRFSYIGTGGTVAHLLNGAPSLLKELDKSIRDEE